MASRRRVSRSATEALAQAMNVSARSAAAAPSRRALLRAAAAGLTSAALGASRALSQPLPTSPTMLTRAIPQTQEPLPVIGFGTWQTFDIGGDRQEFERRKQVLAVLFEAGGKVIDSSPMYGSAEAVVGH